MEERQYPRPLSEFKMTEIYRIIHNERIPGFRLSDQEEAYIAEYREALMQEHKEEYDNISTLNAEAADEVAVASAEVPEKTSKRRKKSKKAAEEATEDNTEDAPVETTEEMAWDNNPVDTDYASSDYE